MSLCEKCGAKLSSDEIGLHMKLINPRDENYWCISCVAKYFNCTEELLRKKIIHFKETGCNYFAPLEQD